MAGVLANGLYLNTESGLTPMLDRLTGMLDKDRQQRDQLAGIAPALAATGVSLPQQPQGMFGGVLSALGIGGGQQQQQLPSPQAPQTATPPAAPADHPPSMTAAPPSADRQSFIQAIAPHALAVAQQTGIDPRIVIAQSALETGFGQHAPGNNYFGIKGQGQTLATNELVDGKSTPTMASFAAYPDMASSAQAYADFINKNPRYAELKSAQGLGPQIAALGRSGYATDPSYATKVGLLAGSIPQAALAFAGQGGATTPGTTDAGADVAAAGLAARTAAGYGTGAQTAAATGAAPMPIASASPSVAPKLQTGRAPDAAPALGAAAGVARAPLGGITNEALGAMIANPESRDLGLKLWQQKLGKGDFGYQVTPDGSVIRTDKDTGAAVLVYQAPVKQGFQQVNGRLVATDPLSGTARDATPVGLPQGYRPATPQERTAYGVQADAPLFIGPDGKPGTLNSGVNQSVSVGADPLMKAVGDRFDRSLTAADNAAKTIPAIRTARQQLDAGIFSGALAGEKLGLQKLAETLGLPGADTSRIVNTETFKAAVGPIVLQTVKGLGAGAGISNADRDFAERMAGGNIELNAGSLHRMLDIQERAATATIQQHNALVDQLTQTPAGAKAYGSVGQGMRISVPPASATAPGQPPRVGSPEEAMRLPPGTLFIDPNGQPRMRP